MTVEKVEILIVDDHPMFRKGMASTLSMVDHFQVVGEAETAEIAIQQANALMPDVILMDIQMGDMSGIEATRRILEVSPHIGVIMVTMFDDDDSLFSALRAGARGYFLKGVDSSQVIRAVEAVAKGEAIFSAPIARRIMGYFAASQQNRQQQVLPQLTNREREVLDLVVQGLDNHEIAYKLTIAHKTVRNHVYNIFSKLHVSSRIQAIMIAQEAGLSGNRD